MAATDRISHAKFAAPRVTSLPLASAQTNNTPATSAAAAQAIHAQQTSVPDTPSILSASVPCSTDKARLLRSPTLSSRAY